MYADKSLTHVTTIEKQTTYSYIERIAKETRTDKFILAFSQQDALRGYFKGRTAIKKREFNVLEINTKNINAMFVILKLKHFNCCWWKDYNLYTSYTKIKFFNML